jgi:hypothetical protein
VVGVAANVDARLLAVADEVARAYLFDAGFRVDPEFERVSHRLYTSGG